MAQNSNAPISQEDYITQFSEKNEGRVTKKLSQEISRTESLILGALSRLDEFLLNPLIRGQSGTAPETSQNKYDTKQGTNEDDFQSDFYPEASISQSQTTQNSGPEVGHDMVTRIPEEITYCSPGTSSRKQKKIQSASQPQFRFQNTLATIEANQILLTLQQLANNTNFADFNTNIH